MKPPDALLDSVTICAAEPAARNAFTPSTTAWPDADHHHGLGIGLDDLAALIALKSGLARSNFSTTRGRKPGRCQALLRALEAVRAETVVRVHDALSG